MTRRVADTLRQHRLVPRFREAQVGNEDYHVTFPFVYQPRIGLFARAIKPLNLAHDQSTKIYDHGEMWVNRIRRLRRINKAPREMLFPIHRPAPTEGRRHAACEEICAELENLDVHVVPETDDAALVKFATITNQEEIGVG